MGGQREREGGWRERDGWSERGGEVWVVRGEWSEIEKERDGWSDRGVVRERERERDG